MATVDVLLLEPIVGLGEEGDCVRVRSGYSRNFLVPRKKALTFSAANKNQIRAMAARREERLRREKEEAMAVAARFEGLRVVVAVRTGASGKMFGSVTAIDLHGELEAKGISIDRSCIQLEQPIRELGQHSVQIKLRKDVYAALAVEIVSEDPIVGAAK
ncbi:MAG: 50S ribosomal protein L9 [Puniceicoccales bacterium]|jgi:large subunit ribosomal protein L9|nr:50S ribosomal protein L9 [Puniceicoccales bacterium]